MLSLQIFSPLLLLLINCIPLYLYLKVMFFLGVKFFELVPQKHQQFHGFINKVLYIQRNVKYNYYL